MGQVDEKSKLLAALKTLQQEAVKNRPQYNAPWFAAPAHVRHYFQSYEDYLRWAGRLGIIDENFLNSRMQRRRGLKIHRDNMGSLMAMVGELTSLVEESTKLHEETLAKLEEDNKSLKDKLKKSQDELAHIKRIS